MNTIDYAALRAVFRPSELEWRVQQAGEKNGRIWAMCVPYVTNRAIQSRLDDVAGPENWQNAFRDGPDGGVLCGISIRVGDEWVTKWDGAENTDVEGVKGGLSNSMKRAAVQWGIGRYLYELDEGFALVSDTGRMRGKTRDGKSFRWDPPTLPAWALSTVSAPASTDAVGEPHEAMLAFIKHIGGQVADTATIVVDRNVHNLKSFVRENWATIKEDPQITRIVVQAIENASGGSFRTTRIPNAA